MKFDESQTISMYNLSLPSEQFKIKILTGLKYLVYYSYLGRHKI